MLITKTICIWEAIREGITVVLEIELGARYPNVHGLC
jgi:hypothetical protein